MDVHERFREVAAELLARRPENSVDLALDRMAELTELLGDPQRAAPVIHISGTNGKTSTARMTDALLRARGLRTGRFTSPHLVSFTERISIDGAPLTEERFIAAYEDVIEYVRLVDARHPVAMSFFEVLTAMAFSAFADAPVDVMVLEVGVGGARDCTNVADGAVAVITPISLDHTRLLGGTVTEIAGEKAGIIKPGAVAVIGQQPVEAAEVLLRQSVRQGAVVAREGIEFGVLASEQAVGGQLLTLRGLRGEYPDVYLPLFGNHQAGNAACALAAAEAFAGVSGDPGAESTLDLGMVQEAFAAVASPGRLEIVRRSPVVLLDAAHNPAGAEVTATAIRESFRFARVIGVLAVAADKDAGGLLDELEPVLDQVVVTRNSSDRSLPPGQLAELAREVFGEDRVRAADRLDEAIDLAIALADEADGAAGALPGDGAVLVTGSVITAGDARILLAPDGGKLPPEPPPAPASRHHFTAADLS